MLPEAPGNPKTTGTGRRPRASRGSGRTAGAYLAAGRRGHAAAKRVKARAVLGELLLVAQSGHLQLQLCGGQLRHQGLLALAGPQRLLLERLVQRAQAGLQRGVVRPQGPCTAVASGALLAVRQGQPAALLAAAHRPRVARVAHVRLHVSPQQHLAAARVAAARGREVAALEVLRQLLQLDHPAAAARRMRALDVQLEDEALERQDVVELLGREATAAARWAAALLHHPGQHTAGAEDVAARRGQRVLQDLVAQSALQVRVHVAVEAVQLEAHGGGRGPGSPPGDRPPPPSQRGSPDAPAAPPARSLALPGLSLIAPDFLGKCPRNRTPRP